MIAEETIIRLFFLFRIQNEKALLFVAVRALGAQPQGCCRSTLQVRQRITKTCYSMDSISTWLKENYDLVTLLVGMIGVLIALVALIYELKKRKK